VIIVERVDLDYGTRMESSVIQSAIVNGDLEDQRKSLLEKEH